VYFWVGGGGGVGIGGGVGGVGGVGGGGGGVLQLAQAVVNVEQLADGGSEPSQIWHSP